MRLNRYLAACGLGSRRAVEQLALDGRVTINDVVELTPGRDVADGDVVRLDGRIVAPDAFEYVLLHKPAGTVTTLSDTHGRPTVGDLVRSSARLFPVGRLDTNTTGVLLLTNDGELANRLMHPSFGVDKTYEALVRGTVTDAAVQALCLGVTLDDGKTAPAQARILHTGRGGTTLEITVHEGKNHQVRRMCEAVGHEVIALRRTSYGGLTLGQLGMGRQRALTLAEVEGLRQATGDG